MKKLEYLTEEQEKKKIEIRDYWLNYIFSCKNSLNREKAKIGIEWLYEFSKLDKPIIIYVDSPMACQIAVAYLKEFLKLGLANVGANVMDNVWANVWANVRANVRDNVRANVEANVWDNVEANVWANVRANVGANVMDNVRANVMDNVRDNVGANVEDNVWANVEANVRANVRANVGANVGANYESFCHYGSISDYGWVSFFHFFTEIGILNNSDFNKFKNILLSGIYDTIQLNGYCIVSDMPIEINRNSESRLHSVNGPSIIFKDGYSQYYFNGVAFSQKLFNSLSDKSYSFEDWSKEENEEVKSLVLAFYEEKFGGEFVYRFLSEHLQEINTYVDKKDKIYLEGTVESMNVGVYTLFKGNVNNIDIAYVRCYCPSTDRMFFLGVHPDHNNAKDAIASLCQIPLQLKDSLVSISRQGEEYSFNFDQEGTQMLKDRKVNFNEVVSLTGDEYFSKIKFEY